MSDKKKFMSGAERFFSRTADETSKVAQPITVKPERPAMAPSARMGRPRKGVRSMWTDKKPYSTGCVFDLDQYVELKQVAYEKKISLREAMYLLLDDGLKRYRKTGKFPGC